MSGSSSQNPNSQEFESHDLKSQDLNAQNLKSWSLRLSALFGLLCLLLGGMGLAGWIFDVPTLRSVRPGLATMKFNNALCFAGTGLALALHGMPRVAGRIAVRRLTVLIASMAALLGLLTLAQDSLGVHLGVDELFLRDPFTDSLIAAPGRLSPVTAFNHFLLGVAVLALGWKRCAWLSMTLALAALLFAFIALMGYAFDATSLYAIVPFGTIAVHTAVGFIVLSLGVLLADPERGVASLLVDRSPGGSMVRRSLPIVGLMPLLISVVIFRLYEEKSFGAGFTLAVSTSLQTAVLVGVVIWIGHALRKQDAARRDAELLVQRQAEREHLLLQELDHRVRNNLVALQALVDLSAQSARSVPEFTQALRARIGAVAGAHQTLSRARWSAVPFHELILALAPPDRHHAIAIHGPTLLISPAHANGVAMVAQELLTNSLKYGALQSASGRLEIRIDESGSIQPASAPSASVALRSVYWRETGGPAIVTPVVPGLGTVLMKELVRFELGGSIELAYTPGGACHCWHLPES